VSFREQLIITIVDKAFIGLFIVLAGYFVNRRLEKFKGASSLTNEFNKQGLEKITKLWEALYLWESNVMSATKLTLKNIAFNPGSDVAGSMESMVPTILDLVSRAKEIIKLIESNRFWLSSQLYDCFYNYYNLINSHLALLLERPTDINVEEFEKDLRAHSRSITNYLAGVTYSTAS
jgi:hypothetical protein